MLRAQAKTHPFCNSLKLALELRIEIAAPNAHAWPQGANLEFA